MTRRVLVAFIVCIAGASASGQDPGGRPEVIVMRGDWLAMAKAALDDDDSELTLPLSQLIEDADASLQTGPFTVMAKSLTPPSGDRHDYLSFGPYWWPNPDTDDGLPYIQRDGELNPEARGNRSDRTNILLMVSAVDRLATAYYFTGAEKYADWAALLLHTWFLNPETVMNPNLDYGQAIPGIVEGRGIGIIDTIGLLKVVDASILIRPSDAWTDDDHARLKEWFRAYLAWLRNSDHGRDESRTRNNHGTWYDAQVATYALFAGDRVTARQIIESVGENRLSRQISPDGRQEHELARTKSFNYCTMNLAGMFTLARLGEHVSVDLWHFQIGDTIALQAALDFIAPYSDAMNPWPYEQITEFQPTRLLPLLQQGFLVYGDPKYARLIDEIPEQERLRNRSNLRYPIAIISEYPPQKTLNPTDPSGHLFSPVDIINLPNHQMDAVSGEDAQLQMPVKKEQK